MAAESVFIYPGGREVPKGAMGAPPPPRPRINPPPMSPGAVAAAMSSSGQVSQWCPSLSCSSW